MLPQLTAKPVRGRPRGSKSTPKIPLAQMQEELRDKLKNEPLRKLQRSEDYRFHNRLRFDQSKVWTGPEPRSPVSSFWAALEEHFRLWGVPAGFRKADGDDGFLAGRKKRLTDFRKEQR